VHRPTLVSSATRRGRFAATIALAAVPVLAFGAELTFEHAFDTRGEPPSLHFHATFRSGGADHQLEVWRDRDRQVKRRTDDLVETYAFHRSGEEEFRLSILDMRKRIHTQVDRTNLYRLGNFTDWFDLTHALRHPRGPYVLVPASAPVEASHPVGPCRWYDLSEGTRVTHICWSSRDRIPLLITGAGGLAWRVDRVDRSPIPAGTFEVHDQGFVRNDANEDIEGD
jgi:hypothetical protein